jgi:NADH dehydrogenase
MIETRHIVTPVRTFLNRSIFYEAEVESIDFNSKQVKISHIIGRQLRSSTIDMHMLGYDYLVIALGGETNFFGIPGVRENCFTMKDIDDAIILRNHILNSLEQANLEKANVELTTQLLTFVIVGGGFNGVETVGY